MRKRSTPGVRGYGRYNQRTAKGERQAKESYFLIEQDESGFYVGEVPQLPGCYAQGRNLDELMISIKEVIQLCLEEQAGAIEPLPKFVGMI